MPSATAITPEIAGRNAIYAMLACNCYHQEEKTRYPVELLGWTLVDRDGDPTDAPSKQSSITSFAYDIYENAQSNKTVIAFRGSDSKLGYILSNGALLISIPYKSATKAVRKYLQRNTARDLVLVGHSLGGGLALSASVHQGVPAITFDPSPRIFDGLGDVHQPALRVVIYQKGELLEEFRQHLIRKSYDVVREEDIYQCEYDFGDHNPHEIDWLARKMAEQGVRSNLRLQIILDRLASQSILP